MDRNVDTRVPNHDDGPMSNLALSLIEAATRDPDHRALRLDEAVLTYAELDEASARVARLLALDGLPAG